MLALAAAYLALLLLAAAQWRAGRQPLAARAVAAATLLLLGTVTLKSLPGLRGWPADGAMPAKFRLVAVHVQQPDKRSGSDGGVFLWAVDAANISQQQPPRAWRLPYSESLHQLAAAAGARLGKGVAQLGESSGGGSSAHGWMHDPGRDAEPALELRFFDVPDPLYPEG